MISESLKADRCFAPSSYARRRHARSASYSASLLEIWKSILRAYVIFSPPGFLRIKPAPDPSLLAKPSVCSYQTSLLTLGSEGSIDMTVSVYLSLSGISTKKSARA